MSSYTSVQFGRFTNTSSVEEAVSQGLLLKTCVGIQEYYECKVCSRSMAGIVPAESHLRGSPHFKALRNYSYSTPLEEAMSTLDIRDSRHLTSSTVIDSASRSYNAEMASNEAVRTAISNDIVGRNTVNGITSLTCRLCDCTTTGETPMAQHLDGEPHRKRQRKMGPIQGSSFKSDSISYGSSVKPPPKAGISTGYPINSQSDGEDLVLEALNNGTVTRDSSCGIDSLTCQVCLKSCNGMVPMKQHLQSSAHLKKLRNHGVQAPTIRPVQPIQPVTERSNTTSVRYDIQEDYMPYSSTHAEARGSASPDHKDVVEEGISKGVVIEVEGSGYLCLVCNLPCTGKHNMTEHLQGDPHRRKLRDQIDHLLMFGDGNEGDNRERISRPAVIQTSLPSSMAQGEDFKNLTRQQELPSRQQELPSSSSVRLNMSSSHLMTPNRSATTSRITCGGRLRLPDNLADLVVYFPHDPLDRSF